MAVKILVTESTDEEGLEMLRKEKGFSVDVRYELGKEDGRGELLKAIPEYDAIIVRSATKVNAELLNVAKKLKVAGRAGTGLDNIDADAATRKGILVINTPSGNTISATEHTIALLLSLVKRLGYGNSTLKNYEWKRHAILGTELRGKTIGIVGLGRIGSQVAKRCKAFEMNVVAYDPYILKEKATSIGVELLPKLDDLLSVSDIVSVHTPLNTETKGIIGKEEIAKMKNGVYLVNCARGGIIDEEALSEALESGKVAGAALDVFAQEPPKRDSITGKLVAQENVIVTPHLGANTTDAQRTVSILLAEQMIAALKGLPCDAVNLPFSLDAKELPKVRVFMQLGEMLGELQSQIAETRIKELKISFQGMEEEAKRPVMVAAVKGFLSATDDEVNYVNAMFLAKEKGMNVKESSSSQIEDYSNLVTLSATSETGAVTNISASLFSGKQIRIIRLNQLEFEIKPTKYMLVVHNRDVPGVVGKIGTVMGSSKINIADFHLCRDSVENKMAGSIINLDSDVPESVLKQLLSNEDILSAKVIKLKAL